MSLLLLAAALAGPTAPTAPDARRGAVVEAIATVQIVRGVRIDARTVPETAVVRETRVSAADGSQQTVRLIEFR